jgi:uncharacterized protein (UPF0264 family)
MAGLLVSVRSGAEAAVALAGGAAIIDVKEPDHGSLGRASPEALAEVLALVAGRRPVSAALGELADAGAEAPEDLSGLSFVKWGLAGCSGPEAPADWRALLSERKARIERGPCRVVVVAYADWRRASAPQPADVAHFAIGAGGVLLLDTWHKDGTTLLDWLDRSALVEMSRMCRAAGVRLALAGGLGERQIQSLLPVQPDWFAVRGAVCSQGQRRGVIEEERVARLAGLLSRTTSAD